MGIVARGSEPWIVDAPGGVDLVRRLEANFPTVEAAGCMVGIGVATGDEAWVRSCTPSRFQMSRAAGGSVSRTCTASASPNSGGCNGGSW